MKFNQCTWRTAGGIAIACCALMAWYGSKPLPFAGSILALSVYWAVFLLFLLIALYMVLIDLRYIRLQYHLAHKELFHSTLLPDQFKSPHHANGHESETS